MRSAKDISYDEKRQRVTLDYGEKIDYSGEATITLKFKGIINNVSWAVYNGRNIANATRSWLASTAPSTSRKAMSPRL